MLSKLVRMWIRLVKLNAKKLLITAAAFGLLTFCVTMYEINSEKRTLSHTPVFVPDLPEIGRAVLKQQQEPIVKQEEQMVNQQFHHHHHHHQEQPVVEQDNHKVNDAEHNNTSRISSRLKFMPLALQPRPSTKKNIMFDILRHHNVTPILLQPAILDRLKHDGRLRHNDVMELDLVIISHKERHRLQNIGDFTTSHNTSITTVTRRLPMDLTSSTLHQVTCYTLSHQDTVYRILVMYSVRHFVYIPSCLHREKSHLFAQSILGETPIALDKFRYKWTITDHPSTLVVVPSTDHPSTLVVVPSNVSDVLNQFPYAHYIECRRDLASNYTDSNEDPKIATDMMKGLIYLKNKLKYFARFPYIAAGTLLGWYRQCNVIKDTADMDMAIFRRYLDQRLHDYIRYDPNIKGFHFNLPEDGYQYYLEVLEQRVDLFFLYDTDRPDWVYGGQWAPERERIRTFYPRSEVCSGVLLGHRVNVPCRVETLIETEYSDKWKIRGDWGGDIVWPWNSQSLEPWDNATWKRAFMDIKDPNDRIEW